VSVRDLGSAPGLDDGGGQIVGVVGPERSDAHRAPVAEGAEPRKSEADAALQCSISRLGIKPYIASPY
jgi:hypothetical protein